MNRPLWNRKEGDLSEEQKWSYRIQMILQSLRPLFTNLLSWQKTSVSTEVLWGFCGSRTVLQN